MQSCIISKTSCLFFLFSCFCSLFLTPFVLPGPYGHQFQQIIKKRREAILTHTKACLVNFSFIKTSVYTIILHTEPTCTLSEHRLNHEQPFIISSPFITITITSVIHSIENDHTAKNYYICQQPSVVQSIVLAIINWYIIHIYIRNHQLVISDIEDHHELGYPSYSGPSSVR